jgi:hypothetical protein
MTTQVGLGGFNNSKSTSIKQDFLNSIKTQPVILYRHPEVIQLGAPDIFSKQIYNQIAFDEQASQTKNNYESMGFTPMLSPIAPHNLSYSGLVNKLPKHKVHFSDFGTQTDKEISTSPTYPRMLSIPFKSTSPTTQNVLDVMVAKTHSAFANSIITTPIISTSPVKTESIADSTQSTLTNRRSSSGSDRTTTPTPGSPNNLFNNVTPRSPNQQVKFGNENPFMASNQIYRTPGSVYQHPNKTPGSGSLYQPSSGGEDSPIIQKKKKKNKK